MTQASRRRVSRPLLVVSAIALVAFWSLGAAALSRAKAPGLAIALFATGLQGPFLAGFALARPGRKQRWRWLALAAGGGGILLFSLVEAVDLDLHGFFELLLAGTAGAAIGHTMATTLVGPLVFGRVLCGWGCWRAMVLERLPVGTGSGRRKGIWGWTPLLGIALSLAAGAVLALVLDLEPGGRPGSVRGSSVWPVATGIALYYAAAIALALAVHDQRAFCKYLCPTGFILRWTSRRALLHVSARPEACTDCGACTRVCPMDIPVAARATLGIRIGNGDCILCQRCVQSCAAGALRTRFGRSA